MVVKSLNMSITLFLFYPEIHRYPFYGDKDMNYYVDEIYLGKDKPQPTEVEKHGHLERYDIKTDLTNKDDTILEITKNVDELEIETTLNVMESKEETTQKVN